MKRLTKLLAIPAAGAALAIVPTATTQANVPGDPGVSGCWAWDATNGCTMSAQCYVRAGFCIVTENVYGFVYSYTVSF
jgi:hypothetical protein